MTVGTSHEHRREIAYGSVLDIGGTVGAVLVTTGPDLAGAEVQLYDDDGRNVTHTEVHTRVVGGRAVHAGLFPAVEEGVYAVEPRPGGVRVAVRVRGGEVTTVDATRL